MADLIELIAQADRALADELDWIGGCRAPVCAETVARLDRLLGQLRSGARVRAELALLDPELLEAGGVLWARRQRPLAPSQHTAAEVADDTVNAHELGHGGSS